MRRWVAGLAAPVVFLIGGTNAFAQDALVRYSVTQSSANVFNYEFQVVNNLDPVAFNGYDLYDVTLFFAGSPSILVTNRPYGWIEVPEEGSLKFFSFLAGLPPEGADIGPSISLAGFELNSDRDLVGTSFTALFFNPVDPAFPRSFDGIIRPAVGSASAPEPSSILFLSVALLAFAFRVKKAKP